jgi:hypothetical protein
MESQQVFWHPRTSCAGVKTTLEVVRNIMQASRRAAAARATLAPAEPPHSEIGPRAGRLSSAASRRATSDMSGRGGGSSAAGHVGRQQEMRSCEVLDLPEPRPVTGADPVRQHGGWAAVAEALNFHN